MKLFIIILLSLFVMLPTLSGATDEVMTIQGAVQAQTQTLQSTNATQNLPADVIATTVPRASAVFITCEDANIRWAVGGSSAVRAVLANPPLGHILYATESLRIVNSDWIRTFTFTSEVVDTAARLQITTERN